MWHTVVAFLKTNWQWFVLAGWFACQILAKIPRVRANTDVEAILNFLKPLWRRVPLVNLVADALDTPEAKPAIQQPEVKP